jgi:hypothetical protein
MTSVYTTATDVANELRASVLFASTTNPTLSTVEGWIEQASTEIDHFAGYVASETTHTLYVSYADQEFLNLEYSPIMSISSIAENTNSLGSDDGEAWLTKAEGTDYFVYSDMGQILINHRRWNPKAGYRRIRIIYSAGYATTPPLHKMLTTKIVAQRVLTSLINSNVEEGNTGGSVSVGSINIVEPADYGIRSYQKLGDDIASLRKELIQGSGVYRYTC